jgi:hypothetical protein
MEYEEFRAILDARIFQGERVDLLRKIADRPERFIGLLRPTKPHVKVLQHLLQSHEIRMGDALEEIIARLLGEVGYKVLPGAVETAGGEALSLDQYFTDGRVYYFIEQKVRDDHDSTKKRGQVANFELKLEALIRKHGTETAGIIYFVDPDLTRNRGYYRQQLVELTERHGTELHLFYGEELFDYLQRPDLWGAVLSWLRLWKDSLPELPVVDFDASPDDSAEELKTLEAGAWRRALENDKLWSEGIMPAMFSRGIVLRLMRDHFAQTRGPGHAHLADLIARRLRQYYPDAPSPDGAADPTLPLWG